MSRQRILSLANFLLFLMELSIFLLKPTKHKVGKYSIIDEFRTHQISWSKPPQGWKKLNVDGDLNVVILSAGAGIATPKPGSTRLADSNRNSGTLG